MSDTMTAFTAKGAELLSRARELVPTLRKRAAEAEKLRRIPPESIDDLRKAGLFRTCSRPFWAGMNCRSTKLS